MQNLSLKLKYTKIHITPCIPKTTHHTHNLEHIQKCLNVELEAQAYLLPRKYEESKPMAVAAPLGLA